MNLYAMADLHIGHRHNWQALEALPHDPDDWLIVAGDIGETEVHLVDTVRLLTERFAKEVSLGYPQHRQAERGIAAYLRKILPVDHG